MTPELTILIVSYNTRALTLACLESVFAETREASFEVIVVDNASSDGSARAITEAFPQVRLLALDRNLGFAAGNNHAAGHARGEWLLLLNPDTQILDGAIDRLLRTARASRAPAGSPDAPAAGPTPRCGIFGGRTRFSDGTLNPTACWNRPTLWSLVCLTTGLVNCFRRSRLFNPEGVAAWMGPGAREVDIISGCFLLLSRSLWEQLEGFDPAFYMYGEEADLCLRARRLGITCLANPEAEIIHHGGASERNVAEKRVRLLTAKTLLLRRHLPRWQRGPAVGLLAAWPLTRTIATRVMRPFVRSADGPARQWSEVWARRREWLSGDFARATRSPRPVVQGQ